MNHTKVAERWMEGRRGTGSNMYTDGVTVFSYGEHFPIAIWLDSARRHAAFCDYNYSSSTCKHQICVKGALRDRYTDIVYVTQEGMQTIFRKRRSCPDRDIVVVKDIEFQSSYDPMER